MSGPECPDCGHLYDGTGCVGPPTPSDIWAGVTPGACDCDGQCCTAALAALTTTDQEGHR